MTLDRDDNVVVPTICWGFWSWDPFSTTLSRRVRPHTTHAGERETLLPGCLCFAGTML
jgi:hypothetical protein